MVFEMKILPADAVSYKKTSEFTALSVPSKLLHAHRTKSGVWGKIVVLEGALTYRILEPTVEEVLLSPDRFGVIEPTVKHEVMPHDDCRFYVEFYRQKIT
ncbi:conserved domain protein [Synechococcus sp. PCC 7335]|nr:conserved domain protein [Synechococcus sp. PCC 7335]